MKYLEDNGEPCFQDWRGSVVKAGDKVVYPYSGCDIIQEAEVLEIKNKSGQAKVKVQIIDMSYKYTTFVPPRPSSPNPDKLTKVSNKSD